MNTETPLIYSARYKVNAHDCNEEKFLTIPALLRSMQECSLQHARNLKTSVWDMEEESISWVLIRKQLKIIEPLQLDDTYSVITYPSGFEKFFAYRDFLIFNKEKKLVAGASSTWTLIDTNTRKLSKIPENILEIGVPKKLKFLAQADKKLGVFSNAESIDSRKVRAYDLDWNNHVSNIVLSRFLLEPIKERGLSDHKMKKILFHFKNEVNLGEELDVLFLKEDDQHKVQLVKKGEDLVAAIVRIEPG